MSNIQKGLVLAGLGGICWGTFGTFVMLLSNIGFSETAIAVFCPISLIILFLIFGLIRNPSGLALNKNRFIVYLIVGVFGVFGTNLGYALALSTGLSVGIASVITFTNYFIVMIVSRFVWKTRITASKIGAGILCVIGIFILLQAWTELAIPLVGLLWILFVTITFAVGYCMCNYAQNDQGTDPNAYFMWTNLIGFIVTCFFNPPWSVFSEITSVVSGHGMYAILLLLGLALIPQVGNYYCTWLALGYVGPAPVAIMYSLDPITAAILAYIVLGQSLNIFQVIGIGIIIASLIWLQLAEQKEESQQKTSEIDSPAEAIDI